MSKASQGAKMLHIGTHGANGILLLSQRTTLDSRLLQKIIRLAKIEFVFLAACYSDSFETAILTGGAKAGVVFSGGLNDAEAGTFVSSFYLGLIQGMTVMESKLFAVNSVRKATEEMLILFGSEHWRC